MVCPTDIVQVFKMVCLTDVQVFKMVCPTDIVLHAGSTFVLTHCSVFHSFLSHNLTLLVSSYIIIIIMDIS